MKMKLFGFLLLFLACSCCYKHKIVFQQGEKQETRAVTFQTAPKSLTVIGRINYYDSTTDRKIRKVRYRSKVSDMSSYTRKYVVISYDSTGKRKGKTRSMKENPRPAQPHGKKRR